MIRSVLGGLALAAITLLGLLARVRGGGRRRLEGAARSVPHLRPARHGWPPGWWLALTFVPVVNIGVAAVLAMDLAECFGKRLGFAFGLVLLPVVFVPVLGFGDASYRRIR